ncbi:MAG: PAS domain-containing protein [Campylobacterota bacterium]|nr:PAS domain-containing protein [Campylobacterota bacterium]
MSNIYKEENGDEWFFEANSYILSETDAQGIIIYANELFCEMAGYTIEELIGQPQNIVRHPDMPRVAFAGLWDDVRTKGFWTGIVKNMRKDGGYYWVHATALRRVHSDGSVTYLSVRQVPSREEVKSCIALYSELKSQE